jgi:hypothetical protein
MSTVPLAFLRHVLDVFSNVSEESTAFILRVTLEAAVLPKPSKTSSTGRRNPHERHQLIQLTFFTVRSGRLNKKIRAQTATNRTAPCDKNFFSNRDNWIFLLHSQYIQCILRVCIYDVYYNIYYITEYFVDRASQYISIVKPTRCNFSIQFI